MKKTFIIIFALFTSITIAQELKEVTLTEIGQGKTKDDAKYSALRNALEKAFGTFISSNTTIFKDELVKDEIVSLSSGNIQNFEILSETQMPNGSFTSVVKATVSIGKLTNFCENKGIVVEYKGGLFAANIKLQEFSKKNEVLVIKNIFDVLTLLSSNCFDFTIKVDEPIKSNYGDNYIVNSKVLAKSNLNLLNIKDILYNTIKSISLTESELQFYKKSNIEYYPIEFAGIHPKLIGKNYNNLPSNMIHKETYYMRSKTSIIYLKTLIEKRIPLNSINFEITDGIVTKKCIDIVDSYNNKTENYFNPYPYNNYKPENWLCLVNSDASCGYGNKFILSKYFLTYIDNYNERYYTITNSISTFLLSLTKENLKVKKTEFYSKELNSRSLIIDLNQLNAGEIEFLYSIQSIYPLSLLSKVNGFNVRPIIK